MIPLLQSRELDYRLIKELWAFRENRTAVRFAYEWRDDSGHWFRSYGNENWEFDENGLMRVRIASINDLPIEERERKYHRPLGRRPDDHPSLKRVGILGTGIGEPDAAKAGAVSGPTEPSADPSTRSAHQRRMPWQSTPRPPHAASITSV
jgi:hypothetical protein